MIVSDTVSFFIVFRFVGTLGIGPKYLVDEYAVLDSRYWVVQDTTVTIVSSLEFLVMGPMCYLWYVKNYFCYNY